MGLSRLIVEAVLVYLYNFAAIDNLAFAPGSCHTIPKVAIPSKAFVKKYKFTIYPEDVTSRVTEGSNFEFRCEYEKGSTKIKWFRRRRLNGTEFEDTVPENLITVRTTPQKSVEVYRIPRVSINDAGVYRCGVDGKNNRIISSKIRILEVIERRAAKFKSVKNFFHFNETKKAEITLLVEEFPFPNITCYKDGKEIICCIGKKMKVSRNFNFSTCEQDQYGLNGVPQLVIESISFVKDDGNYTCAATTNNPPGRDVVSFYVNVGVPPPISTGNSKYFTARHNTEGKIKCMIRWSNPRPNITWYQQIVINSSEPVSNNWTLSLYKSSFKKGKNKGQYKSILKIPWSEDEGSMLFRCVAQNIHGNDSRMFMFIRYGDNFDPFKVFPSGEVILNENEDFMAICRVDVLIRDNIAFYKENPRREVINNERTNITISRNPQYRNVTMKIRNININDSGTYRCSEKNALSNERAVVTLNVREFHPPIIYGMKDSTMDQFKDDNIELICNVSGNPQPKVIWSRNGEEINGETITNCNSQVPKYYFKNDGTTLIICGVDISQSGNYTCFAENQLGNVTATFFLNVTDHRQPDSLARSGGDLSTGSIVGLVIGAIVLLFIVGAVIFFLNGKQKRKQHKNQYILPPENYSSDQKHLPMKTVAD
ncbi:hemicentin-1-like isoform X3 [Xenia sp. Carnegie-2017]|uniref:hemicentin-1-like isoform X3 n=1 Tax=Xenia sp. Carnegie-2017 TaxID=2897299 RepID=UPI001F049E0E|nr:hemicentin-1-like isoform X3 [Xenia sp. Carnegie-2017]